MVVCFIRSYHEYMKNMSKIEVNIQHKKKRIKISKEKQLQLSSFIFIEINATKETNLVIDGYKRMLGGATMMMELWKYNNYFKAYFLSLSYPNFIRV